MILWIDGAYGVGKSTLSEELVKLDTNLFIFDAEAVGNAVRDNMPKCLFNGYIFEGYDLWFKTIVELLKEITSSYGGDILVPMTLIKVDSFDKIATPLQKVGVEVKHLLLDADYDRIKGRILNRGEDEDCWCIQNINLCLTNQKAFKNVYRVNTVDLPPKDLAALVYEKFFK